MKLTQNLISICLIFLSPILCVQAQTDNTQATDSAIVTPDAAIQRTVMNTEFGSIFAKPNGFPYSDFGVYIGAGAGSSSLNPAAIKGHYSRFHHFAPSDSNIGFPYSALRLYEAQQVAAGKPRIFITATYEGRRRPVIDRGSLNLDGSGRPTSSSNNWVYPVNVRDQRFINFWITKYARPVVLAPMAHLGNAWVYVDGVTLLYSTYGVLDNNNHFVAGVKWDEPFPQSGNDFQAAVQTFFTAVKQQAPDVKILVDTGSLSNPGAYQSLYSSIPGMLTEDLYGWGPRPDSYVVNKWATTIFPWFAWAGASGRVNVMGAFLPSNYESGALQCAFVVYELLKGANSFFAPRVGGTALPMSAPWLGWNAKLGSPVSSYTNSGNLFSRHYTNGYVYLNWTGSTKTITLPSGTWFDPKGNRITRLTVPAWIGSFAHH